MVIEISETKIRQAIAVLNLGKTKKRACELLGINYNVKRLDKIISDFREKEKRIADIKLKNKNKPISDFEKQEIIKSYVEGESINSISIRTYRSYQKVKNIIIDGNIPLRSRGKTTPPKTEHIVQDLEVRLTKGQKVFFSKKNCFAFIDSIYDENRIDYLSNFEREVTVELHCRPKTENIEGIHYETYLVYPDGSQIKRLSVQNMIQAIEDHLEKYGREYYLVYLDNKHKSTSFAKRDDLFPIELK